MKKKDKIIFGVIGSVVGGLIIYHTLIKKNTKNLNSIGSIATIDIPPPEEQDMYNNLRKKPFLP